MQKMDELIRKEVSVELARLLPEEILSVTQAHVSKDLSFAKLWVSSYKDIDEKVMKCKDLAAEIRHSLANKIVARKVPSLYFVADKTEEKAENIDRLIKEIGSK
jgi:ribosome-binding factor A